ncbi:MAG: hypothetical protein ACLFS4_06190, partial [Opitutales bacterium]
ALVSAEPASTESPTALERRTRCRQANASGRDALTPKERPNAAQRSVTEQGRPALVSAEPASAESPTALERRTRCRQANAALRQAQGGTPCLRKCGRMPHRALLRSKGVARRSVPAVVKIAGDAGFPDECGLPVELE